VSEDGRLLRQYREQGSQAAFARLAARHLGLVYATCLRETGDAAQAEDAAQVVFLLLARRPPALRPEQSLSGWLFQTARFAAKNTRRREARRRAWEERAMQQTPAPDHEEDALWDRLGPAVNDALAALGAKDREAVLLRFADGLNFPELGASLGTSEDAARMRLNRALGRLRQFFAKQGVTLSVVALAGLLADRITQAAPAEATRHVMSAITAVNASNSPAEPNLYHQLKGALQAMTMTKRYAALAAVLIMGSAGVVFNNSRHASAQVLEASQEGQDAKSISDPLSPNPAVRAAEQQRHIERAMMLRDRWQPWAEKHRALLSQMVHAQPSDAEALGRVCKAIPAVPGSGNHTGQSGISHDDLHTQGALFTWDAAGIRSAQAPSDQALTEQLAKSNAWINKRMQDDFREYHDLRLTEAVSTGRYHTVLWVSGRVTVMVDRDRFVGHGKPFEDYQEVQTEVSPMYDFLR